MNKAEDVFTTARHTKHTDVKRRHPSQDRVVSLIVEKKQKPRCPVGCCVLILSVSHGVRTEFLPFVVSGEAVGLSDTSICKQESPQRFKEFTLK